MLSPLSAYCQELAVNGGFETGNFTGWTNPLNAVVNDNVFPHTGTQDARFANGTLIQTFTTIPGIRYIFSYWVAHTGTNLFNSFTATVFDGGNANVVQNLVFQGNTAYALRTFSYIATSTTATINFTTLFTNGSGRFRVDDVSFFQVAPELDPATSTLPFLFAGMLLALGQKRRQLA